jgi:hypothetical protein
MPPFATSSMRLTYSLCASERSIAATTRERARVGGALATRRFVWEHFFTRRAKAFLTFYVLSSTCAAGRR